MSGLYSLNKKEKSSLDLENLKPYGDTMNDGKVQLSFTLPVADDEKGMEAAKLIIKKMGLNNPLIAATKPLSKEYTYYVAYGELSSGVDYTKINALKVESDTMTIEETNDYIKKNFGRKLVVIGASTGTDAHTVGIDAIMNRKGFAGHYGLERYDMLDTYNLGSQIPNEEFIVKAREVKADVLLVSQTVTQKDIHIKNLTELVELLEAEKMREKVILICGGSRITHELAKELGYDAGFGAGKFADDVISFAVSEMSKRGMK